MKILNTRGNMMLEMVLFTPLAMLFLFVVIDGGLAYREKAAVFDAVRAGINTVGLYDREGAIFELDSNFDLQFNPAQTQNILSNVAAEISSNINQVKGREGDAPADDFKVSVSALTLDIDPSSGEMTGWQEASSFSIPEGPGNPYLPTNSGEYDIIPRAEYLNEFLSSGGEGVSRYAIPLSQAYDSGSGEGELEYLPQSALIFVEAEALTNGVNHSYVKSVVGKYFAVLDRQVLLMRTQVK